MIAKLIASAATRDEAIAGLTEMCEGVRCWPVQCNAQFLANLVDDPAFLNACIDTGLIARELDSFIPETEPTQHALQSVASVAVDRAMGGSSSTTRETYISRPPSPWSHLRGFRTNARGAPTVIRLTDGKREYEVQFAEIAPNDSLYVTVEDDGYLVSEDGNTFVLREARPESVLAGAAGDNVIIAPMPGKVTSVDVSAGEAVTKGQRLLTLEAMKMEHAMVAPFNGVVAELNVAAGAQVQVEAVLARVEAQKPSS
jgi:3-methylcrotonyl-CoA carboxylase alpha subunit